MVLQTEDIKRIIKENPNSELIAAARLLSNKLTAHMTGKGADKLLEQISGLENETQLTIRKKYFRSNIDLFARIHRPEDKIFSAKGGSNYYDMPESARKSFIKQLQDVNNGFSVRTWIESFAKQYYHTDPMGLIFIEVGDNTAYPTYKSTAKIYDYQLKGRKLEYVVFLTDEPQVYRVIDDVSDVLVKREGDDITILDDVYPNYFNVTPGYIISDIIEPNTEKYTSPDWEIIQVADEFLRECSVKSIYKLKHGFPKAWQYAGICSSCKGTGHYEAKDCKACNGSGKSVSKDASEVLTLPIPEEGQPTITPDVAGYVTTDIEGWSKMTEELKLLEDVMTHTYWGTHQKEESKPETATGRWIDVQPINDRLTKFSVWAEDIESYITNMLGTFYYNTSYRGSSITYGRRYLIEDPDAIWEKYEKAREKGSPWNVLDVLLKEYYESKYQTDALELSKHIKLMKVEPFIHLTLEQAKTVVSNFPDYTKKLYFSEWLNQLPENDLLIKTAADLSKSLTDYVAAKKIQEPAPPVPPKPVPINN